jgi:site-specific recombinase XerD
LDLVRLIADYTSYLKSHGYASRTIDLRLKHLRCLNRFIEATGLKGLEEFGPELASNFTDYWVRHQPWAKTSKGFKKPLRFGPHHHIAVQHSLHSFLRWAYSAGCLQRNVFPLKPPVRGNYFFPEIADYLRFCEQHKGLAKNSMVQIELFVRRFDQFLCSVPLTAWNQFQIRHIDLFVRQQASHNIGRIQRVHKILRGLFRYLFSFGRLERDWASALLSPRRYKLARTPRTLAVEQVLRLLRSIDRKHRGGKRDLAIILVAASLGVRASEIAELRLQDLDWTQAVVAFPAIKSKNVLRLPLSRPLIEALADYLKNERPAGSPYRNVFLSLTPPFKPLTWSSVSMLIVKRMRRAGIQASGHQLRHGFASEVIKCGVPFSTLQELLGHSHYSSTQVYTKIDLTQLREVAVNDAEDM